MRIISFCYLLLILISCSKKEEEIKLSDQLERAVVGEGYFTDEMKYNYFDFSLSNNFESNQKLFPNGISLYIKTSDETYEYSQIESGRFKSTIPFAGEYDKTYQICFTYLGKEHCATTVMPSPIVIDSITFDSLSTYDQNFDEVPTIKIHLNNEFPGHYLKFDISTAQKSALPTDTIWTDIKFPVYRVARIPVGNSMAFSLPISKADNLRVSSGAMIKVKTYVVSPDIGEYLSRLSAYIAGQLSNGQYYNPPHFFTNEAYGLSYGTIVDSVIYHYQ